MTGESRTWIEWAGTVLLGDITVPRLGYGTMQLPGPGAWGPPPDADAARRVMRDAVDQGVRFIDTSGYYGPDVANELVAEALHPYPADLLIATKVGVARGADRGFVPAASAEAIRRACERDATVLRVDTLDLVHLRQLPSTPESLLDSVGVLADLHSEGMVRQIGVSNVTAEQLHAARSVTDIVSVENEFNMLEQTSAAVLEVCERDGIAFLPFHPLGLGALTNADGALASIAAEVDASTARVAIAWLLHRSPVILPIPGTSSPTHLRENLTSAVRE